MITRFRASRERLGLELSAIDDALGEKPGWSFDLDLYQDEARTALSLRDLHRVATLLRVPPAYLAGLDETSAAPLTFLALQERLRAYLAEHALTSAAFADTVGWELEPFLNDPTSLWEWNVDGVIDLCTALGLRPVDALPPLSSGV